MTVAANGFGSSLLGGAVDSIEITRSRFNFERVEQRRTRFERGPAYVRAMPRRVCKAG